MKQKSLTLFLSLFLLGALCACGDTTEVNSTEETVETSEVETLEEEANSEAQPVEETAEEITEEPVVEAPEVEMVDFDTWAKQEGNDEVCVVVWNEQLKVQKIITPTSETRQPYEIQEGDRFAIPYRENIESMGLRDQPVWTIDNFDYFEMSLPKGEVSVVDIIYTDENGERIALLYSFK